MKVLINKAIDATNNESIRSLRDIILDYAVTLYKTFESIPMVKQELNRITTNMSLLTRSKATVLTLLLDEGVPHVDQLPPELQALPTVDFAGNIDVATTGFQTRFVDLLRKLFLDPRSHLLEDDACKDEVAAIIKSFVDSERSCSKIRPKPSRNDTKLVK